MDSGLKGKSVLVTGASGGIGSAIALALADEGARVVLHCHRNRDAVEAIATVIGDASVIVQADVADEQAVDRMYAEALERVTQLDAIVVNAGIRIVAEVPLHEMTLEQWRRTMECKLPRAKVLFGTLFRAHSATYHPCCCSASMLLCIHQFGCGSRRYER